MGIVELRIVPDTLALRDAFKVMQDSRRSAVVARDKEGTWLIEAVVIVRGISRQRARIDQIEHRERQRLTAPSLQRLARGNVNLTSPEESWNELESILDEEQADVAVLAAGRSYAVIITRHEGIEARLEPAPKTCYCTSEPRCDGGGTHTGGNCNVGHVGTVYCV